MLAAWLTAGEKLASRIDFQPPRGGPPFEFTLPDDPDEGEPLIHFPQIERAALGLAAKQALTRPQYDALAETARMQAFTVAKLTSLDAIERIQRLLEQDIREGGTLREFQARVDASLGESMLSPGHVENIYRTNVAQAYADGQRRMLAHPIIGEEFPYVAYESVADSRRRPEHGWFATHGLNGTNCYRTDDPTAQKFWAPWDYQCRCGMTMLTIEQAARRGVIEAKRWVESGEPPVVPQFVKAPSFDLPSGWVRLSVDASGHEHKGKGEGGGQFVKGGSNPNGSVGSSSDSKKTSGSDAEDGTSAATKEAAADYAKNGTKAKAFKEWFGDWENDPASASKIVNADGSPQETLNVPGNGSVVKDASGKPAVVYHGTPFGNFEKFALYKTGSNIDSGFLGKGFYFTNSPQVAEYYAKRGAAKAPTVLPAYLSVKNPFQWGKKTLGVRGLVMQGKPLPPKIHNEVIKRTGFKYNPDAEIDFNDEPLLSEAVRNVLIDMGYDGVVSEVDGDKKEYVAFEPNQIKAVENVGTFDSSTDNLRLSAQYHGPDAPGPDWKQVGVGPQGGKIWEHEGDTDGGDPKQGRVAKSVENVKAAVAKAQAAHAKVTAYLDSKTNQPGVRHAKAVVGAALGAVKKTQGALYGVMEQRYGKAGARSIFIASQLIGGNPVVMPAWFVAIPGATILAQLPMMGIAEVVLQTGRAAKAIAARLSETDVELSDDDIQELAKELLGKLYAQFLAALEPHKDTLTEAFAGIKENDV